MRALAAFLLLGSVLFGCATRTPALSPLARADVLDVFDPAAQVQGRPPDGGPAPGLRVLDLSPTGPGHTDATIRLRLDRAVFDPAAPPPDVRLTLHRLDGQEREVAVVGRTTFPGADRVEFHPDDPLPRATAFVVRQQGVIAGRDGDTIAEQTWSFETQRPGLRFHQEPWNEEVTAELARDEPVFIGADLPLDVRDVATHLTATTAAGREVKVAVRRATTAERNDFYFNDTHAYAVAPVGEWPSSSITIATGEHLASAAGPLTTGELRSLAFRVRPRLDVVGLACAERDGDRCPRGPVRVALTTEPGHEWYEHVRIVPEPTDLSIRLAAPDQDDDSETHLVLEGEFVPGKRYVLVLDRDLQDVYEQRLGRTARVPFSVTTTPARGTGQLRLVDARGSFAAPDQAIVGIEAERVIEARVRIAVLPAAQAGPLLAAPKLDAVPWPQEARQSSVVLALGPSDFGRATATPLSLTRYAAAGSVILVEVAPAGLVPRTEGEPPAPVRGLFSVSGLGVTAHVGPARGVARVTSLHDAAPVAGIPVALADAEGTRALGRTDADGLVALPGAVDLGRDVGVVVGAAEGDALAVPLPAYRWPAREDAFARRHGRVNRHGILVGRGATTDEPEPIAGLRRGEVGLVAVRVGRGIYMPGDPIHAAGWASVSTPYGTVATRRGPADATVVLRLRVGEEVVTERTVAVNDHGRFFTTLRVPTVAALGDYTLEAEYLQARGAVAFVVGEPRIPTFELAATADSPEIFHGETMTIDNVAHYLSGEPAPMEVLFWDLRCSPGPPSAPRLPRGFVLSTEAAIALPPVNKTIPVAHATSISVALDTGTLSHRAGLNCWYSASAQDASFQLVGASTGFFVHPAARYLAHRLHGAPAGSPSDVEVIAVTSHGDRVAQSAITVQIDRIAGAVVELPKPESHGTCKLAARATGEPERCTTGPLPEGHYRVRLTADVEGRPIEQERRFWVSKPTPTQHRPDIAVGSRVTVAKPTQPEPPPPVRFAVDVAGDELIAGQDATVEVVGPWPDARGVLIVEQTGLRRTIPFHLRQGKASVTIRPVAGQGPNVELVAWVDLPQTRSHLAKVERVYAVLPLQEPQRDLRVQVTLPERARPGERVAVKLAVTDEAGHPVAARVALWVIDDGLHQLRAPSEPWLARIFNPDRQRQHAIVDSVTELQWPYSTLYRFGRTSRIPHVRSAKAEVKGALDSDIRSHFDPAPLFVGDVATDAQGRLQLPLSLPDDLTRWHVSAIASAALAGTHSGPSRFGRGDATMNVTTPLNVRVAIPRSLRPGDRATVAALVHAPSAGSVTARIEVVDGQLKPVGETTRVLAVEAGRMARLPFSVRADGPEQARVRVTASFVPADGGAARRGGVERDLPVLVERTAVEHAAIYGSIADDRPIAIPVRIPRGAHADWGGVTVSLSSSVVGELQDAASFLLDYPYGCLEQTSSRLLPLTALAGLADRLPAGVDPTALADEAIARIVSMQRADGRLAYWPDHAEVAGFSEGYALWVLQLAREAGLQVPASAITRASTALARDLDAPLPASADRRAYALAERAMLVMALGADAPVALLDALWDARGELPFDRRAMLAIGMHAHDEADPRLATLLGSLSAALQERPAVAHVVDSGGPRTLRAFESGARDDALALLALLALAPDDPRIEKLARGLRDRRRSGRWRTTQENAFALVALSRYARAREAEPVDHRLRAWVGARRAIDTRADGVDDPIRSGTIGMAAILGGLGSERITPVVVERTGTGRAYWRAGVQWVGPNAPARAQGLRLSTTYLGQDGPTDRFRTGERYALKVTLATDAAQHHVAVEIPLPGGLEAIDLRLGSGRGSLTTLPHVHAPWLSHVEYRADRIQLFFDELPAGEYAVTVWVLAATPGEFVRPAAIAEAMYEPETRARTQADRIVVDGPAQ